MTQSYLGKIKEFVNNFYSKINVNHNEAINVNHNEASNIVNDIIMYKCSDDNINGLIDLIDNKFAKACPDKYESLCKYLSHNMGKQFNSFKDYVTKNAGMSELQNPYQSIAERIINYFKDNFKDSVVNVDDVNKFNNSKSNLDDNSVNNLNDNIINKNSVKLTVEDVNKISEIMNSNNYTDYSYGMRDEAEFWGSWNEFKKIYNDFSKIVESEMFSGNITKHLPGNNFDRYRQMIIGFTKSYRNSQVLRGYSSKYYGMA